MSESVNKRDVWIVGTILFVGMALTLPVLFYLAVVGEIMTYATMVMMSLPVFLHPIKAMQGGGGLIYIIHLLVYGIALFGISAIASWCLCRCPFKVRAPIVGAILIVLLKVSGLDIFGFIGHGSGNVLTRNAYGMWAEVRAETSDVLRKMDEP